MSLQIQSVQLSPNPVTAGENFTLSVRLAELTESYIPWRGSAGNDLADRGGANLFVYNTVPSQTVYQSRWREQEIDALLSAWISLNS